MKESGATIWQWSFLESKFFVDTSQTKSCMEAGTLPKNVSNVLWWYPFTVLTPSSYPQVPVLNFSGPQTRRRDDQTETVIIRLTQSSYAGARLSLAKMNKCDKMWTNVTKYELMVQMLTNVYKCKRMV